MTRRLIALNCALMLLTLCLAAPTPDEVEEHLPPVEMHSQADAGNGIAGGFKFSVIPTQPPSRESVNLEHEAIPSKILSAYDNSQQKARDTNNPLPVLDTISEHEKYGNTGDMFDGISRTIVNGYELFSNLLNRLIQAPQQVVRSFSRGLTEQLNIIGNKVVGL